MHKLDRPTKPNNFDSTISDLLSEYPPAGTRPETTRWNAFRDTPAYTDTRKALYDNQKGTCAYCEISLSENNQQIEHFTPKSKTTKTNDLTYSFENYILSCKGGTNHFSRNPDEFLSSSLPKDNHTCGESKKDEDPTNRCLNPYELPAFPLVKERLTEDGISFSADINACRRANINIDIVKETIKILNLNCTRLSKARMKVWQAVQEEIDYAFTFPKTLQKDELESIANTYIQQGKPFYTTALLCLADEMPQLIP